MMEPEKYYEFYNGLYGVHFANRKGLSIEEITDIFSEFGTVVTVRKSGDDYGYRFVKYREEEEVLRCIEGLRNHPTIRLRISDPNYKSNRKQTNNNETKNVPYSQKKSAFKGQKTDEHRDNSNRRPFEPTVAESSASTNNNSTADIKKHSEKNDAEGSTDKSDILQTKANNPQDSTGISIEAPKAFMPLRQPQVAAETFMPINATKASTTDEAKSTEQPLLDIEKSFKPKALKFTPANTVKSLDFLTSPIQLEAPANEMPKLVEKTPTCILEENDRGARGSQDTVETVPATATAEEVIVANIHSNFGVHYILHLIRKHNPLCVSEMKFIPSLGLRYCTVYLESMRQAQAIEKEFDCFNLSGKDLIVLRPQTLSNLIAAA